MMKPQIATIHASLITAALLAFSASALAIPTLWGIDEDDGHIFSVGDYTDASNTYTDYGAITYRTSSNSLATIGKNIESFTINRDTGYAYFVVNSGLANTQNFGTLDQPVLLKLLIDDLVISSNDDSDDHSSDDDDHSSDDDHSATLTPSGVGLEAEVIGRIDASTWSDGDNITGIDFDSEGNLWVLHRDSGDEVLASSDESDHSSDSDDDSSYSSDDEDSDHSSDSDDDSDHSSDSGDDHASVSDNGEIDKLLRIDVSNANVLEAKLLYGWPDNGDESDNPTPYNDADTYSDLEVVTRGEDFIFDDDGNLFIADDDDEEIYQGDIDGDAITNVFDARSGGGISGSQRLEALAWDYENDRLIAFDDKQNVFALITAGDGGNSSYGGVSGLTDVEGLAFYDISDHSIPTPGSALLLGLGLINLEWLRRRRSLARTQQA